METKREAPLPEEQGRLAEEGGLGVVLIVDDEPNTLSMLHDTLDAAGFTVLVATDGQTAISRALLTQPEAILLDARMPGMDGFEVARHLKGDVRTRAIPVIFMTGLTDTEHVLEAFAAGSADYVTKPIKPNEVLARLMAHIARARATAQARQALDAVGRAALSLSDDGDVRWFTPQANNLLLKWFGRPPRTGKLPGELAKWYQEALADWRANRPPAAYQKNGPEHSRLSAWLSETGNETTGEALLILKEDDQETPVSRLTSYFNLTRREAEVLYWASQGKTARDIADILFISPRTADKHLERVYKKLRVETRAAATCLAIQVLEERS
ncbi:MAG: response regulator [Zoogloeaceae bacterium]|nr:response regulator [Zoogloeaceae bacterium]